MVWVSSKLKRPPKSCIPSRAKMMMKRKRSSRREAIDFIEFSSEPTRLLSDAQCLRGDWLTGSTGRSWRGEGMGGTRRWRGGCHPDGSREVVVTLVVTWGLSP